MPIILRILSPICLMLYVTILLFFSIYLYTTHRAKHSRIPRKSKDRHGPNKTTKFLGIEFFFQKETHFKYKYLSLSLYI